MKNNFSLPFLKTRLFKRQQCPFNSTRIQCKQILCLLLQLGEKTFCIFKLTSPFLVRYILAVTAPLGMINCQIYTYLFMYYNKFQFKVYWLSALYVPLTIYKIYTRHDKHTKAEWCHILIKYEEYYFEKISRNYVKISRNYEKRSRYYAIFIL